MSNSSKESAWWTALVVVAKSRAFIGLVIGCSDRSERFAEPDCYTLDDPLDLISMANRRRTVSEIPIHNLNGRFLLEDYLKTSNWMPVVLIQ